VGEPLKRSVGHLPSNNIMRFLVITFLSFVVVVISSAQTDSQNNESKQCPISKTQDIPTVNFCDVIRNPSDYAGKLVRLKGSYLVGGETRVIGDPKCEGAFWVEYDNVADVCTTNEIHERMRNHDPVTNGLFNGLYESEIVAVGLILHDEAGFGHMNAYKTELGIKWIEQATPLSRKKLH
jgi:hypothetical protein